MEKCTELEQAVDSLLDEWEFWLQEHPDRTIDQFLSAYASEVARPVLDEFRKQVSRLIQIDRQLVEWEDTSGLKSIADTKNVNELADLAPGVEPIQGYTLVSRLGRGGFGEVWKASAPGGFHVALKFVSIKSRLGRIEERSLSIIRDIRHPNLLSYFGTWTVGDVLIIATELADGTVCDRFNELQSQGFTGIPADELLGYMEEAAKGIDYLNEPNLQSRLAIQHRDIKPQNLLLAGGSVKVGDFGLARTLRFDHTGHTGSMTLAYAAPEYLDGTTSNRSDQYSLAVTYCYLRGGRLPFEGTQIQIIDGIRKNRPDLSMIPECERLAVARALEKSPIKRWPSSTDFVQAIRKSLYDTTSANETNSRSRSISYGILLSAVVLLLIMLVGVAARNLGQLNSAIDGPREEISDSSKNDTGVDVPTQNQENEKQSTITPELPPISANLPPTKGADKTIGESATSEDADDFFSDPK